MSDCKQPSLHDESKLIDNNNNNMDESPYEDQENGEEVKQTPDTCEISNKEEAEAFNINEAYEEEEDEDENERNQAETKENIGKLDGSKDDLEDEEENEEEEGEDEEKDEDDDDEEEREDEDDDS